MQRLLLITLVLPIGYWNGVCLEDDIQFFLFSPSQKVTDIKQYLLPINCNMITEWEDNGNSLYSKNQMSQLFGREYVSPLIADAAKLLNYTHRSWSI
jgi:hypothetical protein